MCRVSKKKHKAAQCPLCHKFMAPEDLAYHYRSAHEDVRGAVQPTEQEQPMAVKQTKHGELDTTVDPKTQSVDLPHMDTTTNYEVFGRPFERGGQEKNIAGKLYIPPAIAGSATIIHVTLMKGEIDKKSKDIILPPMHTTNNFEVYGLEFARGSKEKTVSGKLYVPIPTAKGVTHLRVTLVK